MNINKAWVFLGVLMVIPAIATAATVSVPWSHPVDLESWQEDGITYVRATEFFTILGATVDMGTYPVDGLVRLRGHTISLYHASPFVTHNSSVYNLSVPVFFREGDFVVPLVPMSELVGQIIELKFTWNSTSGVLQFFQVGGIVGPIDGEVKRNGLILTIHTGGPVPYEVFKSTDDWLTVTILGGELGKLNFDRRQYSRYIWEFKSYQFEESVQLSFRLRPQRLTWAHRFATDPNRIEITLIDTTFALDSSDQTVLLNPVEPAAGQGIESDPIELIVIDAGHGGEDRGAVGRRGTKEKDVVLGIALELAKLLRKDPDFKVILTREEDVFIPLKKRADIANHSMADLFISLHANSAPRKSARGFETFFLSDAKTDEARATEQFENASLRFEEHNEDAGSDDLSFILADLMQNEYVVESAALAEIIQKEFGRSFKTPDRGVNTAGFVVLYHAYMPAVLVETGFLSNRDEEAWLSRRSSQKELADALYISIKSFRALYQEAR